MKPNSHTRNKVFKISQISRYFKRDIAPWIVLAKDLKSGIIQYILDTTPIKNEKSLHNFFHFEYQEKGTYLARWYTNGERYDEMILKVRNEI